MKTTKFKEHQSVLLTKDFAEFSEGTLGTIVHLYADGLTCEVEFISGTECKVVTLPFHQIKPNKI
jgi:hypothetical protein